MPLGLAVGDAHGYAPGMPDRIERAGSRRNAYGGTYAPRATGDDDATERRWRDAFLAAYADTGNVADACRRVQEEHAEAVRATREPGGGNAAGGVENAESGVDDDASLRGSEAAAEPTGDAEQAGDAEACPVTPWWVARSRQRSEGFAREYGRIRQALGTRSADRSISIAEDTVAGLVHPSAAQVAVRAHQWYAARAAREEWGDRVDGRVEISGKVEHAGLGGELASFIRELLDGREPDEPEPAALPDPADATTDDAWTGPGRGSALPGDDD